MLAPARAGAQPRASEEQPLAAACAAAIDNNRHMDTELGARTAALVFTTRPLNAYNLELRDRWLQPIAQTLAARDLTAARPVSAERRVAERQRAADEGEPLRESCRLQPLRGWSHVKYIEEVFAGGS